MASRSIEAIFKSCPVWAHGARMAHFANENTEVTMSECRAPKPAQGQLS